MDQLYRHAFFLYRPGYFLFKGLANRELRSLLSGTIRPGTTVLDIGANIGFFSCLFSDLVGHDGTVYAFEPNALNFDRLCSVTRRRANVRSHHVAVGQSDTMTTLYCSRSLNVDHRLLVSGHDDADSFERRWRKERVQCVALDSFLDSSMTVDFVKIDVQGAELQVLNGMQQTLARSPAAVILIEFWPYGLIRAGTDPGALLETLNNAGFSHRLLTGNKPDDWREFVADWRYDVNLWATRTDKSHT